MAKPLRLPVTKSIKPVHPIAAITYHDGVAERFVVFRATSESIYQIALHFAAVHAMEEEDSITVQVGSMIWEGHHDDILSELLPFILKAS